MYSVIAGVLLAKVLPSSLRTKSPPKKCLTGPSVGASGSTIAITKGPLPNSAGTGGRRANVGGPAVVAVHAKRNQFCRLWYVVQGQTYHCSAYHLSEASYHHSEASYHHLGLYRVASGTRKGADLTDTAEAEGRQRREDPLVRS